MGTAGDCDRRRRASRFLLFGVRKLPCSRVREVCYFVMSRASGVCGCSAQTATSVRCEKSWIRTCSRICNSETLRKIRNVGEAGRRGTGLVVLADWWCAEKLAPHRNGVQNSLVCVKLSEKHWSNRRGRVPEAFMSMGQCRTAWCSATGPRALTINDTTSCRCCVCR